jgi:hypothetical protein
MTIQLGVLFTLAPVLFGQSGTAPTIASLSASRTVTEGEAVSLSVSVNGTAPFTYQWKKGGTAITGATASALVLDPIHVADAGNYTVVVTNSVSAVTSGPVILAVNPAVAPSFSYAPSNRSYTVGDTLYFDTYVNGTAPFTFVWKKGSTVIATNTSSSYSKSNVQLTDAGTYTVTATNIAGSATSSAFTVAVTAVTAPTISSLYDSTVNPGESFYFSPSISGSGNITYQWKKDGVAISGATSSYYSKYAVAADAGNYTLTATNSAGSTTSNTAKLTVRPPVAPTISSISGPVSVNVGGSFSLSVYVNGTSPFTYQWQKDGQPISGATTNYYSKSNVQSSDAGAYTVVVTNAQGSVTSTAATVSITTAKPPTITYIPSSGSVRQGDSGYSINAGATGTGNLTYQWSKDGTAISGATSSSYYINHLITSADAGSYRVVVTNSEGSATSEPFVLTVLPPLAPTIVTQPVGASVHQAGTISLYVGVSGSPTLTYQWRKDGVAISGATSSSYYKSNAASSDGGTYSVVVTNSAGSATSVDATVTVTPASAPKITADPASASLLPGDSFYSLYVGYQSDGNTTVQWYLDGVAISGATYSTYYIYGAQPSNAGSYTAVVTNSAGSATSRAGVITVDSNVSRPVITYVQGSRALSGGSYSTLTIATSGSGESVQWFKDGVLIANATSKDYSISNFSSTGVGTYTAQVTNSIGTYTSAPIVLTMLNAGMTPVITTPPTSMTTNLGYSASFSAYADGEYPLTYQWKKDGTAIAGAISNYLYLSSLTAADAGAYTVTVTNHNGSVTSPAATLTVNATATSVPVISTGPASQTVTLGSSNVNLFVSLIDSTGASYQWYKDGVLVPGGTSYSLYYYATATAAHAGRYHVVVTNSAGSVTSSDAVVTVTSAASAGPSFTTQPASISSFYGNSVTFTAAATGASNLSYQWRKDGTAISGATSSTLTLTNAQASNAGTYTVVATDSNGSTSSMPALLTLSGGTAPSIITAPSDATVLAGGSATFVGAASGTPTPTLQWKKNGVSIAGATNGTLTIQNVQSTDAGTYAVVATNGLGSVTSSSATLTVVYPPPSILTQPTNVSTQPGGLATFSVTATTVPTPSYQWRKDGNPISGATSNTLVLTNVQASNAGRYSVVVSTAYGSVTSVEAVLTVGNPISVTPPQNQTVTAGSTATFAATVTSIDPLVFRWAKNGVVLNGANATTLTLTNVQTSDAGTYVLAISRPDGTVVYPLTGSGALFATLTVLPATGPVITLQPVGGSIAAGGAFTLMVQAKDSGPIGYQWQKNGVPIPNQFSDTLVLTNVQPSDAADYRAFAIGAHGSTGSNTVKVVVTGSKFAGTYFGSTGAGDSWALQVDADGSGTFLAMLGNQGQVVIARGFKVLDNGAFSFGGGHALVEQSALALSSSYYSGPVSATISCGTVSGQLTALGIGFSGIQKSASTAPTPAGCYQAVPLASGMGEVDVIAAPDGTVLLVAVDSTGVRGGRGTVTADGTFSVSGSQYSYSGTLVGASSAVQGTYAPVGGAAVAFATPATSTSSERLINVATRGYAAAGSQTLIGGFVISGSGPKDVLIRAVGPGLSGFGVSGCLANPRLRLFKDGTAIMDNDDWGLGGFASEIASTATKVGAFPLTTGSADSAIVARLDPGNYSAQVTTDGVSSGVVMIEIYDANSAVAGAPKLINLSTRGYVDQGANMLIAGVVVTGNAPKKLLIRAVGPGLKDYGVADFVSDPKLQLFKGSTVIRENDNWSDSVDASEIASAATAVGAFPLTAGGKDAVLLVYLAPGNYTAQVSGVGGATGVGMVEIYEVP